MAGFDLQLGADQLVILRTQMHARVRGVIDDQRDCLAHCGQRGVALQAQLAAQDLARHFQRQVQQCVGAAQCELVQTGLQIRDHVSDPFQMPGPDLLSGAGGVQRALLAPARVQMKASSPPLAPTWIWPSSASRRTTLRISRCSASTSEMRTGPLASRSSRSVSAARPDMFLKILSRSAWSEPFNATIKDSDWISRSSS